MTSIDKLHEIWRPIPLMPEYDVSSHGRVRREAPIVGGGGSRRPSGTILRERALPTGHRQVTVSINNKPRTYLVHRLVAAAFLAVPAPGQDCVCHRDDNPANNRPENLFWGTRGDNSFDKVSKCRHAFGERVGSAKLTANQIAEVRLAVAGGERQRAIARRYGISQSNVSQIVAGRTWGRT